MPRSTQRSSLSQRHSAVRVQRSAAEPAVHVLLNAVVGREIGV